MVLVPDICAVSTALGSQLIVKNTEGDGGEVEKVPVCVETVHPKLG